MARLAIVWLSTPATIELFDTHPFVVSKSTSVARGASLPGAAADNGANEKNSDWLDLAQAQDDTFVAIAQEDGGALNPAALDLLESAVRRAGGTKDEKAAMRTYWRQRIAVANARGVAGVIRARTRICTGAHWPLQPHHSSHLQSPPGPLPSRATAPRGGRELNRTGDRLSAGDGWDLAA